ncbi:MAG: 50S ribosomal protein L24 [Actinomycetota bacterium]
MQLKQGDQVMVISGKDKGKESRIAEVFPKVDKIIVEGVATAKRHTKPRGQTMQGGIVDKDMPINASNVMIVCPTCGPTRIGHKADADGHKRRVCVKCGGDL